LGLDRLGRIGDVLLELCGLVSRRCLDGSVEPLLGRCQLRQVVSGGAWMVLQGAGQSPSGRHANQKGDRSGDEQPDPAAPAHSLER
jgi:hypothetical protein